MPLKDVGNYRPHMGVKGERGVSVGIWLAAMMRAVARGHLGSKQLFFTGYDRIITDRYIAALRAHAATSIGHIFVISLRSDTIRPAQRDKNRHCMSLERSPLLAVYRRQTPSRTPVWFMRQAGRYLPEYQAIRKQCSMLDAIRTPETAAEITLQPLRRFDLDAAIIFADILNPLIGMGMELDFVEKEGPRIFNPIASLSEVQRLTIPRAEDTVGYTLQAIAMVAAEINPAGIPVLGFAGAPFTLASYMIEGGGSSSLTKVKQFMYRNPEAWKLLNEKLIGFLTGYLAAQAAAGASAVQIFDSWAGYLSPYQYELFVAPYLSRLLESLRRELAVPVVYFSTGTFALLPQIAPLGFDVLSVDWRGSLAAAAAVTGPEIPLQGNLDPEVLAGPQDNLAREIDAVRSNARAVRHHVFNLGHGILPHTPPENLSFALNHIRSA